MQVYANIFPQIMESHIHDPGGILRASVTNQGWLLLRDKVTESMNKQTHSRRLHCSVNTGETFIAGSNHTCDKRGSVFPATALSSQMISVLIPCCGEAFQFSIQNQGSQDKFNYKENTVTNYFQSNARSLPQPQKEIPA